MIPVLMVIYVALVLLASAGFVLVFRGRAVSIDMDIPDPARDLLPGEEPVSTEAEFEILRLQHIMSVERRENRKGKAA